MSIDPASISKKPWYVLLAVNVLVLLVLLEGVLFLFVGVTEGRWVYSSLEEDHPFRDVVRDAGVREVAEGDRAEGNVERLHPYFGYVLKPRLFEENRHRLRVNNHGFFTEHSYPIEKASDDDFIIAILGGSVALDVSNHEVVHRGDPTTVVEYLKQIPGLENKAFRIMNLASGGFKQPQQLLILSYFLSIGQDLDLILNIDGFNEVALSPLNHEKSIAVSMPSAQHLLPLTALADGHQPTLRSVVKVAELKEALGVRIDQLESGGSAIRYVWSRLQAQSLLRDLQAEAVQLEQTLAQEKTNSIAREESLVALTIEDSELSPDMAFQHIVDGWLESSILIHQLAASRDIPYVHVLQPNQYHPTDRTFTEYEQKIFGNTPYIVGVERGYPLLIERSVDLEARGISFLNAGEVFDEEPEGVYRDGCCHYTFRGQQLFSSLIGSFLVSQNLFTGEGGSSE